MRIVIITDGNNQLGLGHVYQSLTLATALKEKAGKDVQIDFMTKSDQAINHFIHLSGFEVECFDNDEEMLSKLIKIQPDQVIFDKLDVCPLFAKKIKQYLNIKLTIFTNLTEANDYADIVVFAGFGSNFKNIIHRNNETGSVHFFGLKFWILRPEFYALKKKNKSYSEVVKKIMLIFGGSDPSNLSSFVLNELLRLNAVFQIQLVLGAGFQNKQELNCVLHENKNSCSQVNIVQNTKNVAEMMYTSDLVFTSPGLSLSEALAVGTPVVGFHQNERQRIEYADFLPTFGVNDLHKISSVIINKSFLFPNNPMIQAMEIGEGKNEIIDEILN